MKTEKLFTSIMLSFIIGLVFALTGCGIYGVNYDIGLREVEHPAQVKERYGEKKIVKVDVNNANKNSYEDDFIKIIWSPLSQPSQFSFTITNKTDHSIKIIWDEAVFVDHNGKNNRVMHNNVRYIERDNSKPPSIVVRKGDLEDIILPISNVLYKTGIKGTFYAGNNIWFNIDNSGWIEMPLFPVSGGAVKELNRSAEKYVGKKVQILLPLQIEDVVNEYIFTFEVSSFNVKKATPLRLKTTEKPTELTERTEKENQRYNEWSPTVLYALSGILVISLLVIIYGLI